MATIIFMGTPDFAVPTLRALIEHHTVIGVVTQPDRPAGRGGQIKMSPIKLLALEHGIPVLQPEKIRRKEAIAELKALGQPDFSIVAAFGQILPQEVLDIPRFASINVHASLLPRWRGAAPIHASIRAGDPETGVTIMMMDAGLDTGDMLTKRATPISDTDTVETVHDRLAIIGAELLIETLPGVMDGSIQPQKQDESLVTFAPQIEKHEGEIDWSQSALAIDRTIRAFTPWPSTFTTFTGKMLKIHQGKHGEGTLPQGMVGIVDGRVGIGTSAGVLFPTEVQIEGKKRVSIDDFVNGHPHFVNSQLPS